MSHASSRTLSRGQTAMRGLPWLAGLILIAGILVFIGERVLPSHHAREQGTPIRNEPADVIKPLGKHVPFTSAQHAMIKRFVDAGVMRKDLVTAYAMAAPELRQGMTLKQWKTGNIPVVPYPDGAIAPEIKIDYSTASEAMVELALFPAKVGAADPVVFLMTFRKVKAQWKIDSWAPKGISGVRAS